VLAYVFSVLAWFSVATAISSIVGLDYNWYQVRREGGREGGREGRRVLGYVFPVLAWFPVATAISPIEGLDYNWCQVWREGGREGGRDQHSHIFFSTYTFAALPDRHDFLVNLALHHCRHRYVPPSLPPPLPPSLLPIHPQTLPPSLPPPRIIEAPDLFMLAYNRAFHPSLLHVLQALETDLIPHIPTPLSLPPSLAPSGIIEAPDLFMLAYNLAFPSLLHVLQASLMHPSLPPSLPPSPLGIIEAPDLFMLAYNRAFHPSLLHVLQALETGLIKDSPSLQYAIKYMQQHEVRQGGREGGEGGYT